MGGSTVVGKNPRLANEAFEALYRAQIALVRELKATDIWDGLLEHEYAVLNALRAAPAGLRHTDLFEEVGITQAGLSRLITRMVKRGLIVRADDPDDGRACRLELTERGARTQRRAGAAYFRYVSQMMSARLDDEQLTLVRDTCAQLLEQSPPATQLVRDARQAAAAGALR